MTDPQPPKIDLGPTIRALGALGVKVEKALAKACTKGAYQLRNHVVRSLQAPKHGKVRKSRGSKAKHRASAPGEPPAVDLGGLVKSIQVVAAEPGPAPVAIVQQVDNLAPYGKWLEYGTRDGKIQARPYMTPAAEAMGEPIRAMIVEEVRKALGDDDGKAPK